MREVYSRNENLEISGSMTYRNRRRTAFTTFRVRRHVPVVALRVLHLDHVVLVVAAVMLAMRGRVLVLRRHIPARFARLGAVPVFAGYPARVVRDLPPARGLGRRGRRVDMLLLILP